jgi:excisionase family DNA binding protein
MRFDKDDIRQIAEQLATMVRDEVQAALRQLTPDPKPYLTVNEAAKLFQVGPNVFYDAIRRGELQPLRVGRRIRFTQQEIEAWAEARARDG